MWRFQHHWLLSGAVVANRCAALTASFAPMSSEAAAAQRKSSSDYSHVNRNLIWGLWNEGNLFSLSVGELSSFLAEHCNVAVDPKSKKSALVRQVEEFMSQSTPTPIVPQEDTVGGNSPTAIAEHERGTDFFEESDVYGDWGAEPGFEDKRDVDFMELSASKMGEHYETLSCRAFQLLHESSTADVALCRFDPSRLPGQKHRTSALTVTPVNVHESNRIRFRRGLQWCLLNLWNMNMPGEINIGAGKVLYWRDVAKHNRPILPLWTLQTHLYNAHPFAWFALAHTSNTDAAEAFATEVMGMSLSQEATTTYKLTIRKTGREMLDCELNSALRCTLLQRPWDRFLMTHYIRNKVPDLRFLVRARHAIKKRIADMYLDADILRSTRDSVQSVMSPELGEVTYCCERVIRKWGVPLTERGPTGEERSTGLTLQLVETKRTPLIVTKLGDEGTRLEYELILKLPTQSEKIDTEQLADNLWEFGNRFARALEPGMENLSAFTMPSSAAFEPLTAAKP